jgi:hypothetical protein
MGTALTREQAALLARYAREVVVGYDGDPAGEGAFGRALPLLLGEGLAVRRARFGAGHDPDSLRLEAGEEAVRAAVEAAEDGVLAEIERLLPPGLQGQPHLHAGAAEQVAEYLKPIRDPLVRYQYGRLAAQRLGVADRLVLERLDQRSRPPARAGEPAGPASDPRTGARTPGLDLEQTVLGLLIGGGGEVPPPGDLPGPEVFLDTASRNIFRAFRALYTGESGGVPTGRQVKEALAGDRDTIDRLVRLLVERPVTPEGMGLPAGLDSLRRRWEKQRLTELAREIHEAQRVDDPQRLERLLRERTELIRRHHPGTFGDPLARRR